jgi:16S rRNA (uracil1498-N3)-methyltransferase
LSTGDDVEIFDGEGNGYVGEVEIRGSAVFVCRLRSLPSPAVTVRLVLAAALIKSAKFEWMLQKATELGVSEIVPLRTNLSEIRIPGGKIAPRLERWDRIVKEAARQCGRFFAPRLHAPLGFPEFLNRKEFAACDRILFDSNAGDPWQPDRNPPADKTVLCIGPEGGWETGEVEQAVRAGFRALHLGLWTLRSETAAIVAVAIFQHQVRLTIK